VLVVQEYKYVLEELTSQLLLHVHSPSSLQMETMLSRTRGRGDDAGTLQLYRIVGVSYAVSADVRRTRRRSRVGRHRIQDM
jgi:hypothetical protein